MPDSTTRRLRKYLADMERIPFDEETERTYNGQEARAFGVDLNPDWQVKVSPEPSSPKGYRVSYLTPDNWTLNDDGTLVTPNGDVYTPEDIEEYENQLQYQASPGTVGEQAQAEYPGLDYEAPPEDPDVVARMQADYQGIKARFGTAFPEQDIQAVLTLAETQPEQFVADLKAGGRTPDTENLVKALFPDITEDEVAQLFQTEPEAQEGELTPQQKAYRKYKAQGGIMEEADWLAYQKGRTFTEEGGTPGEAGVIDPLVAYEKLPESVKQMFKPSRTQRLFGGQRKTPLTDEQIEAQQQAIYEMVAPTPLDVLTMGGASATKVVGGVKAGVKAAKEAAPVVGRTLAEAAAGEAGAIGKGAGKGKIPFNKLISSSYDPGLKGNVRNVHTGTVDGKPAWTDGFMMELKPVPDKLRALKTFKELDKDVTGKPRDFTQLVPNTTDSTEVKIIMQDVATKGDMSPGSLMDDTTLLSNRLSLERGDVERAIPIKTKYVDYFQSNYPDAQFLMKSPSQPVVVKSGGKTVGVIMPLQLTSEQYDRLLKFAPKPEAKVPSVPVTPVGKEAWQMTLEEFIIAATKGEVPIPKTSGPLQYPSEHQFIVATALSKGKPVPESVLKDYPDLKPLSKEAALSPAPRFDETFQQGAANMEPPQVPLSKAEGAVPTVNEDLTVPPKSPEIPTAEAKPAVEPPAVKETPSQPPPPIEPPKTAVSAAPIVPPKPPTEPARIIEQAAEQVKQAQPGKVVRALEHIPGIRQALQWERPALKLTGEAQKIHVAMVGQVAARTDVATRELSTRLPLLRQAQNAFGKEALSGGKVDVKFRGTADQAKNPITGTLKDIAENPELYDLTESQKKWLADLQARNDESLSWVVEKYGAEIGRFNPKPGGAFLPNVDISDDVVEWMGSESAVIARGRGKTRFYQTARERMAADPTFKPETDVRKLIEGIDSFKASAAGGIVYRQALGGLTKLEVIETTHPELYAKMTGLRQQLQSLKGSLSRLDEKLGKAVDDFLKSPSDDIDINDLQSSLDVKLASGPRKDMPVEAIQQQLDEVRAAIKDLRPAWEVANPKPYVFVQNGIFRYFPSDQAKLIQESLKTTDNPLLTFIERWRGGAFSGDVSPFAIQGSVGVLADPIGSVKTGIGAAKSAVQQHDILRSFKMDALADDIAADPQGWAEYASMRGFAPSGTPTEYAAGFLSKIPGFDKFTEATYLTVTRQGKALWTRATNDLIKAGVPELEAKIAAISMVNKVYPFASASLLGQSQARSMLLRALPTSYSFMRAPAEMIAQSVTGMAKLVTKQTLTPQERMAVKLVVTMAASVLTASAASAAVSAKARGKSDEEVRQAVLDAINPDPYNGKFASLIIGDKRVPLGGPYRAIFRALFPQDVKGVPYPVPMYGLLYWNDKKQMPDGYLWNRINPALKTQIDLFYNRDYAGKRIRTAESVPLQTFQAVAYEIENALPLSLGAAVEGIRHGDPLDKVKQDIISQFAGVNMVTLDDTYFDRQIKRLGQVDPNQEPKPFSIEKPVYTIKNLWSDVNRVLADSTQEEIGKRRMPALAKTITEVKQIKNQVDQTRNHALTDKALNPDTGDTFVQFYEQWQERSKLTDEKALAEFDKKYPKARYGNMTAREYDALRRYTDLKESDPAEAKLFLKAHPELKANPREDWLKAHPDENARLAVMAQAKIASKEAWDKAQSYIQQWDIPDSALPDFDLPEDEETRNAYFEYRETSERYGAASPEAYLMLAKNGALRKYLNHSDIKTPVPALEIQVKNRALNDQYEALTNEKEKTAFKTANPKWADDRERVEAYQEQYKFDNTVADTKTVDAAVKYSHEAEGDSRTLYRVDNPDFDAWGQKVYGWKPLDIKSVDALRLRVKNKAKTEAYEKLTPANRAAYLRSNPDFATDQQRIEGFGKGVPKESIDLYAKYELTPTEGQARERLLLANKDYHDKVWVGILGKEAIDPNKVASEKFDTTDQQQYKPLTTDAERDLFRYLNPEFDQEGVKIGRWKPLTVKSGEARKLAVEYQKQDREYASIPEPAKQKQYLVDHPEFAVSRVMRTGYNDGVPASHIQTYVTWKMTPMSKYALERFMVGNQPFYNEVYKGVLGKEKLDFRNILSESLEAQLKVYNDLRGSKKTAYLKSHGALRKWMERERKLRPSQATDINVSAPVLRVMYA